MASIKERLAASLKVLKDYQQNNHNLILHGYKILGATHTRRLISEGYLKSIIKGWYVISEPGQDEDTTVRHDFYWSFIVAYANFRFKNEWCLTPEESLSIHANDTVVPKQIVIRSPKGTNNMLLLKNGDRMLDIFATLPYNIVIEPFHGLRIFSIAEALVFCSSQYYISNDINIRICLLKLNDTSEIIRLLAKNGYTIRAARLCGALRNVRKFKQADEILHHMQQLGYTIRVEDPFADATPIISSGNSFISIRIEMMWDKMRTQIMSLYVPQVLTILDMKSTLDKMSEDYISDAFNSLTIDGFIVSEELIKCVSSDKYKIPATFKQKNMINTFAARGYYQAFVKVQESVMAIFKGSNPNRIVVRNFYKWHTEFLEPFVSSGILQHTDECEFKINKIYTSNSRYPQLNSCATHEAKETFCSLLLNERNIFVKAILGHFFMIYIHPYALGNGNIARLLMNIILLSGNYPWTTIPAARSKEYLATLEKARLGGDIREFTTFILSLL